MSKKTKKAAKVASPAPAKKNTPRERPASGVVFLKPNEVKLAKRPKRPSMFDSTVQSVLKAGTAEQHVQWPIPESKNIDTYRAQVYNGMHRSLRSLDPKVAAATSVSVRLAESGKEFVVTFTRKA